MNDHASQSTKASKWIKAEAQLKKRALECRKIRLWLRDNPGATSREIGEATGVRNSSRLFKMLGMGIVRSDGGIGKSQRWYVVPQ